MTEQRIENMTPEQYANFVDGIWVFLGFGLAGAIIWLAFVAPTIRTIYRYITR
jgi:hypothetical protein